MNIVDIFHELNELDDNKSLSESYSNKRSSKTNRIQIRDSRNNKENITEEFVDVGSYPYKYIPIDSSAYNELIDKGILTEEEIDAAYDSDVFPEKMWLESEAFITMEDGYYQVSWGGYDDYYEAASIGECAQIVEDYYEKEHIKWIGGRPKEEAHKKNKFNKYIEIDKNTIQIKPGTKKIPKCAFDENTKVEKVIIPDGVQTIEFLAFGDCSNLKSVVIPESVKFMGQAVFADCSSLESITIPGGIKTIDINAFNGCKNLANVVISEGVWDIEIFAFARCPSLENITIPSSVRRIDRQTFTDSPNLVIICDKGSYAEQYANENGIKTRILEEGFRRRPSGLRNLKEEFQKSYSPLWDSSKESWDDFFDRYYENEIPEMTDREIEFTEAAIEKICDKYNCEDAEFDPAVQHGEGEVLLVSPTISFTGSINYEQFVKLIALGKLDTFIKLVLSSYKPERGKGVVNDRKMKAIQSVTNYANMKLKEHGQTPNAFTRHGYFSTMVSQWKMTTSSGRKLSVGITVSYDASAFIADVTDITIGTGTNEWFQVINKTGMSLNEVKKLIDTLFVDDNNTKEKYKNPHQMD